MVSLSPCQKEALKILTEGNENVFLTGLAGSGKSFLIKHFLTHTDPKAYPIVASTGMAAILVGGRTFHSFFGLGILEGGIERVLENALKNRSLKSRLKNAECVIVDEVSMLPGLALDCAETICRAVRANHKPWGGLRIIAVGDFSQLPPIQKPGEGRLWAFKSRAWLEGNFRPLVLKTMMRSEDEIFLNVLNEIRQGRLSEKTKGYLNGKVDLDFQNLERTYLFSRRHEVDDFNEKRLSHIESPLVEFPTLFWGSLPAQAQLKKIMPLPATLQLKKSCLVMIRVNDPLLRYVNGSLGTVVDMDEEMLTIELRKARRLVEIEPTTFSLLDGKGNPLATARNFPVNLAYATTIHKAQGSTLDEMVTDLRRLWEPGHAYVALSRLRTGAGLTLAGWDETSIKCDPQVLNFHASIGLRSTPP